MHLDGVVEVAVMGVTHPYTGEADKAFVIGIFSMLDQMLGMPLASAVGLLHMPDGVDDADNRCSGRRWSRW